LLNRDGASAYDDYLKYADAIDYIALKYNVTNKLFSNFDMSVSLTDTSSALNKNLTFSSGNNLLKFSKDEVEKVMTTYPFHPNIDIALGKAGQTSALKFNRSALSSTEKAVGATVYATVKMNGDTPITVWGGKE